MNNETASANVGKMDEAVEYGTVPEVLSEGASCAPDAMDVDASANSSENFDTIY